ncbi:uncharacterized protein LOC134180709 [Corticium candelabrum]|uniref:uncharacterized protein LOC134180709 n=1 Tax=Corticium candelabrum TaxID=121492 RepID=UPI002E263F4A|nr:uncharacterized protein LOC134180709 [Corticium candelabrum]
MEHSVMCGSTNFSAVVEGRGLWIGWVYYDAYRQSYSQWFLWTYAILSIIGNVAVIVWRVNMLRQGRNRLLSVFFMSLATADCLWGVHLLIFQIVMSLCVDTDSMFYVDICGLSGLIFAVAAPAARFNIIFIAFHLGLNFVCAGRRYWRERVAVYVTSTLLAMSWILSLICGFVFYFKYYKGRLHIQELGGYYADWTQCSPTSWGMENNEKDEASNIFITGFTFSVIFLVSTSSLYLAIICRGCCLRGKQSGVIVHGMSRWAVVLLVAIAVNILSSIPILFRGILVFTGNFFDYHRDADIVFNLTVAAIALQFQIVVNPVLYSMAAIIHRLSQCRSERRLVKMGSVGVDEWMTTTSRAWGDTNVLNPEENVLVNSWDCHVYYKSTESKT